MGVDSIQDLATGVSRLAQGDASTAIAVTMHLGPCWSLARLWRHGAPDDRGAASDALELMLQALGRRELVVCGAGTESGTHTRYPLTEARKVDGGWAITGNKIFVTLTPEADMFHVFCRSRAPDDGDTWLAARAWVPRASEGLKVVENWDSMGMRASGSHSLELRDCFVPEGLVFFRHRWGEWSVPELMHAAAGNLALSSAFLGIAEEASSQIRELVRKRRKAPSNRLLAERTAIQTHVARIEQCVSTARAVLERTSRLWDCYLRGRDDREVSLADAHQLMAEYQCAKAVVERNAITAVDLALTASGGAGYLSASPLSRLYRDVRAGPFMQPYSPIELYEYVGKVRLCLDPSVEN
jgi:alkylation response protein AidB-like acyl-CoA dehydrogenase